MNKIIPLLFILLYATQVNSQDKKIIKKVEVSIFKELIKNNKGQLIDVRTTEEFKNGAIENAQSIDFFAEDFKENLLQLDIQKPVYVYCQSGGRSSKTSKILVNLGFKNIYDLKGGYKAWLQNKE